MFYDFVFIFKLLPLERLVIKFEFKLKAFKNLFLPVLSVDILAYSSISFLAACKEGYPLRKKPPHCSGPAVSVQHLTGIFSAASSLQPSTTTHITEPTMFLQPKKSTSSVILRPCSSLQTGHFLQLASSKVSPQKLIKLIHHNYPSHS